MPPHPSWDYFRRGSKKNSAHHNAHCLACDAAGTPSTVGGTLQPMLKHLRECTHCPTEAKQLADPDKAANQSGNDQQLEKKQGRMHTVPQASAEMTKEESVEFNRRLLRGTIRANLPFTWIEDEDIQAAFKICRETVKLPGRQKLSGKAHATCFSSAGA